MISIDTIGTLYTPGTYDDQGEVITAPVQLPGYHVNTTHPVAEWEAFEVFPATPARVFGGHETRFYEFLDEGEFTTMMELADLSIPEKNVIPHSVTMRQARLALLGAGLLGNVDAAIASLPEPQKSAAQIEWQYASEVQRNSGLVPAMASALGMTDAQIDQLFVAASTL